MGKPLVRFDHAYRSLRAVRSNSVLCASKGPRKNNFTFWGVEAPA